MSRGGFGGLPCHGPSGEVTLAPLASWPVLMRRFPPAAAPLEHSVLLVHFSRQTMPGLMRAGSVRPARQSGERKLGYLVLSAKPRSGEQPFHSETRASCHAGPRKLPSSQASALRETPAALTLVT